jgi:hypothetical protein
LPVTKTSAFPSGSVYSLTGTSSTAARYSTLGSKKMQGFLSWMQASSSPFALTGPLGTTICSNRTHVGQNNWKLCLCFVGFEVFMGWGTMWVYYKLMF